MSDTPKSRHEEQQELKDLKIKYKIIRSRVKDLLDMIDEAMENMK